MPKISIYRCFTHDINVTNNYNRGGPLFIPRIRQGSGRHDIPALDGVLYGSLNKVSSIAEYLRGFMNNKVSLTELKEFFELKDDNFKSVAKLNITKEVKILDLTEPDNLVKLNIKPSDMATHTRQITQDISAKIFTQGYDGFLWWSVLESRWTNVTLYELRIKDKIEIGNIEKLSIEVRELQSALELLNITILK